MPTAVVFSSIFTVDVAATSITGASFSSPTFTVRSVESVRPPASVAVTVTEYALESSLDPPSGVS